MSKIPLKSGTSPLRASGCPLGFTLQDFWQWSLSDLVSNASRGVLAEFIVATALGVDLKVPRDEWKAYDLLTPEGTKVEVKSAAYVQSWYQRKLSNIVFSTKPSHGWDAGTNEMDKEVTRQADVYVFCLLKHQDKDTIDPLNLDQWDFYVVSTKELDDSIGNQACIRLKALKKLSNPVSYDLIRKTVLFNQPKGQK